MFTSPLHRKACGTGRQIDSKVNLDDAACQGEMARL